MNLSNSNVILEVLPPFMTRGILIELVKFGYSIRSMISHTQLQQVGFSTWLHVHTGPRYVYVQEDTGYCLYSVCLGTAYGYTVYIIHRLETTL